MKVSSHTSAVESVGAINPSSGLLKPLHVDEAASLIGLRYLASKKEMEAEKGSLSGLKAWVWTHHHENGPVGLLAKIMIFLFPSIKTQVNRLDHLQLHAACYQHMAQKVLTKMDTPGLKELDDLFALKQASWQHALEVVCMDGLALGTLSSALRADKEIVLLAIEQNEEALQFASPELQKDPDVLKAINPNPLSSVAKAVKPPVLAAEIEFIITEENRAAAIESVSIQGTNLQGLPKVFRSDKLTVMAAVHQNGLAFEHAGDDLRADKDVAIEAAMQNGASLFFAAPALRDDVDVVLAAVKSKGIALSFAGPICRANKQVVMAALESNPRVFRYVDPSLKQDPDVLAIMAGHHHVLKPAELLSVATLNVDQKSADWQEAFKTVSKNGLNLRLLSEDLRADIKIVIAAISQHGWALEFAADKFKDDDKIYQLAITEDGRALQWASDRIRNTPELVTQAVLKTGLALEFASHALRNDPIIVTKAVKKNGMALKHASEELQNDKEVVLAAVRQLGHALQFASLELRNDKEVVLAAVIKNGKALQYASDALRADSDIIAAAINQNPDAQAFVKKSWWFW